MTIPSPIILSDGTAIGTEFHVKEQSPEEASAQAATEVVTRNHKEFSDEDIESVRYLMKTDKVAFVSALLHLFKLQTEDELRVGETVHRNNVGFRGGYEGKFMTSIAQYYIKHHKLSEPQLAAGRKTILKYAGQLIRTGFIDDYLKDR